MKKIIAFLSFLMISVSALVAQKTAIDLKAFKKEPLVTYNTMLAVLKFDKQSFLDMYASMENGNWVARNEREHKSAMTAIEWLKNQKKPVQLDENMTDQSKPETALVWLVKNLVGGALMMKGEVQVYEQAENVKQGTIYVEVGQSELSGGSYTFYFYNRKPEFFKAWNVNELVAEDIEPTVEVIVEESSDVSEEVVFAEPVQEVANDENTIYTVTEIQPEYPGGMGKWNEYVKKSLNYPKDAAKMEIQGTVFVQFVVQETGKLTDFTVIRGIGASCDKEALRLCKESIDWKPGKQRGKAVKVRFVMPIKFDLASLDKK